MQARDEGWRWWRQKMICLVGTWQELLMNWQVNGEQ